MTFTVMNPQPQNCKTKDTKIGGNHKKWTVYTFSWDI